MLICLVNRVAVGAVILGAACWSDDVLASPIASLPPLARDSAVGLRLDFDARTSPPDVIPGWSLRTDLDGFNTAPATLVAPPAKAPDPAEGRPDKLANSGDTQAPQNPDSLPEPASILVFAIGLAGLYSLRRSKRPEAASRFASKPGVSNQQSAPSPN